MPRIANEEAFEGLSEANQPKKLIEEAKEKCQIVLDPNAKEFLPRKATASIESQFVEDAGAAETMGQLVYRPPFVLPYEQQRAKFLCGGSFMSGPRNLRKFHRIPPKSKLDTNDHSIDYTRPSFVLPYQKQNNGSLSSDEKYLTPTKVNQNAEEACNPYNQTYFSVNRNAGQSLESTKYFKKIRFFSTNATYLGNLSQQYFSPELVNSSQTLKAVKQIQPRDKAGPKAPRAREGQGSRQRKKLVETYTTKHHRPWTLMHVWPKDKLGLKVLGNLRP